MEQLRIFGITVCVCICLVLPAYAQVKLHQLEPDLQVPEVVFENPTPGKRVQQVPESYQHTDIHHMLYLPTDWRPGQKYPVIVEYAGNAWQSSLGTVEGSALGYGISGGRGVIWLCLPFVDVVAGNNAKTWWGDVDATIDYCLSVVEDICTNYGGDSSLLFIAGFSRGAIACNYIALHNDEIASLWRGFICHSHYDGVRQWDYSDSDPISASDRLERLKERPQFVSHEVSVDETKDYLTKAYPQGDFTFMSLTFAEHTDKWVLYDLPERDTLRVWFSSQLKDE
ncbi:MAG: hypothetical protein HKN87_10445 [Saprospiraceae bacterium]|nr:hypothetical protein [Saprospiraceae bacterium]